MPYSTSTVHYGWKVGGPDSATTSFSKRQQPEQDGGGSICAGVCTRLSGTFQQIKVGMKYFVLLHLKSELFMFYQAFKDISTLYFTVSVISDSCFGG